LLVQPGPPRLRDRPEGNTGNPHEIPGKRALRRLTTGNRLRLLHGPYEAPPRRVGVLATCLSRECDVVVTSWTDAPISWPQCRPLDVRRSHPGLLVNEGLARAIRQESAAALTYWWGASEFVIWKWRRALGVSRTGNEGTRRLVQAAAEAGARAARDRLMPLRNGSGTGKWPWSRTWGGTCCRGSTA
jgi:hypothetical protein